MADLEVEVFLDKGAVAPFVAIDLKDSGVDESNKGSVSVAGSCGDGSVHMLVASFHGPSGATMGVTVKCAGAVVCAIIAITIRPSNEPFGASHKSFTI